MGNADLDPTAHAYSHTANTSNTKVPEYQNTSAHITTHRVLIVPDVGVALQAPLSAVRQTEFYAGFMRSSAKITLTLGLPDPAGPLPGPSASTLSPSVPSSAPGSASASVSTLLPPSSPAPATWSCGVCGHANPLPTSGLSPATKCALCGVAYATSRTMSPPPSRAGTPASLAAASSSAGAMTRSSLVSETDTDADSDAPPPTSQVACPACTFLNHPSLAQCEICGTPLPRKRPPQAQGRQQDTVRLSFRKGGDKEAYRRLKGVLSDKVWERVEGPVARRDGEEKTGAGIGESEYGRGRGDRSSHCRGDHARHLARGKGKGRGHAGCVPRPRGADGPRGRDGEYCWSVESGYAALVGCWPCVGRLHIARNCKVSLTIEVLLHFASPPLLRSGSG